MFKKIINWFNTSKTGRTAQRFIKTFCWAFIGYYVATKSGTFQADWLYLLEGSLLTALGFGADKGLREYKKK